VVPIDQYVGWIPTTVGNQTPFADPQLIILDLENAELTRLPKYWNKGVRGSVVVKAPCYMPEDRSFETR
jgi:hypothetical protein